MQRILNVRGGHFHMSVDIKCLSIDIHMSVDIKGLSIDPFFRRSYTNDRLYLFSPQPMTPLFSLLYQILHTNCKFLRASCAFWEILTNCGDFTIKFGHFDLKLHFCTLNDPILGVHTKGFLVWTPKNGGHSEIFFFFVPTKNDPLFSTKSYTERPLLPFSGRHLYVTFILEYPRVTTLICNFVLYHSRFLMPTLTPTTWLR